MKRLGMVVLGVGLLAVACVKSGAASLGSAPSGGSPSPTPSQTFSGSPGGSPSPSGRKLTFEVWFAKGGKLFVTKRTEPFSVAVGKLSLDALAAGPSVPELAAQVRSDLPANVTLSITALAGGNAMVHVEPAGQA